MHVSSLLPSLCGNESTHIVSSMPMTSAGIDLANARRSLEFDGHRRGITAATAPAAALAAQHVPSEPLQSTRRLHSMVITTAATPQ